MRTKWAGNILLRTVSSVYEHSRPVCQELNSQLSTAIDVGLGARESRSVCNTKNAYMSSWQMTSPSVGNILPTCSRARSLIVLSMASSVTGKAFASDGEGNMHSV